MKRNVDRVPLDGGRLEVPEMDNHRIIKVWFQDLAVSADCRVTLAEEEALAGNVSGDATGAAETSGEQLQGPAGQDATRGGQSTSEAGERA